VQSIPTVSRPSALANQSTDQRAPTGGGRRYVS
jgi:hypothetical protein